MIEEKPFAEHIGYPTLPAWVDRVQNSATCICPSPDEYRRHTKVPGERRQPMKPGERPSQLQRRALLAAAVGAISADAVAQAPAQPDSWTSLARQIFADRAIRDGSAVIGIDAPYRAEDAALVPIGLHTLLPDGDPRHVVGITLVIDENPSPLAAVFTPGPIGGMRSILTRVRVDSYTNLTAVAELSDGQLYAAQRFIKAAGGCSAPAAKQEGDPTVAGEMRFRQFPQAASGQSRSEAQLMIRHPNYSGMQMDQLTRLYIPAHFIKSVKINQGRDPLLSVESGISISENPVFRFDYRSNGAATFSADIEDSDGRTFHQEWSATAT
jgi:sulfur-oxidizing protein SoxY